MANRRFPIRLQIPPPNPNFLLLPLPPPHLSAASLPPRASTSSDSPPQPLSTAFLPRLLPPPPPLAPLPPLFLPFRDLLPVASSSGLVYLWASDPLLPSSSSSSESTTKSLVACNPLTRHYRILPHLGSAWSRHGVGLADSGWVIVLMEPAAALYSPDSTSWVTFVNVHVSKSREC
ncbi:SKP1-interacting partner 15 [Linum perenne]